MLRSLPVRPHDRHKQTVDADGLAQGGEEDASRFSGAHVSEEQTPNHSIKEVGAGYTSLFRFAMFRKIAP
jgi:hypothetical protein